MLTIEQANDEPHTLAERQQGQTTDEEKWTAALARDPTADGSFVFAVRSTGIYCRPSCPARRPRRTQVAFYTDPDQAEQSGYQPCKRCKPRGTLPPPKTQLVSQACSYIDTHLEERLTLSNIGTHVGASPFYLQRTFKKILGISPREYVDARRLTRVKHSLKNGETVTQALYKAGFTSRSRLYEKTHNSFGLSPGEVRRGGSGYQIEYTIIDCPLGRLLLGTTQRGVCAVCIGDSDIEVETALSEEYPLAEIRRADNDTFKWASEFAEYFAGQRSLEDLPIDVVATAFQWKVWKKIRSIPYGRTTSYAEMARTLGTPRGARAVGRACSTNPVALLVPCHRVIGVDGALHGYRWGVNRKKSLLELERGHTPRTGPA
jgi:AraC family transcriptional regulator, regulatory protein of adaptative response / methylated-DNA-[protein]-cysteine methyltransferase